MNKQAIQHIGDSKYSFAIGGNKYRIRLRTAIKDDITKVEIIWDEWCKLYLGGKKQEMKIMHQDELFNYYQIDIESKEPGYAYVFLITTEDGKKYYYSQSGIEEDYNFSTCFLDEFMATYPNEIDIVKPKKCIDGRLFYQIFPERFAKSSNKTNTSYITMDWYEEKVTNDKYMGGDLNGIKERLPYLKSIGVGSIYLCPIHPSPSAHKYDVNDYFDIDPMFGTKEDFKELVKVAHEHDICIIMDMVFNHASFLGNLMQDVVKKGKKSKYFNWFFIEGDKVDFKKRNYLTFADVPMMPKLNTSNKEVIEYLKSIVRFWAENFHVDGFRLDVAFEVSHACWKELKRELSSINPEIVIYGEHWINSESYLDNSEWDSVMNYPLRLVVMKYLLNDKKDAKYLSDNLNTLLMRYKDTINHNLINLYDSHDTERFFTVLNENIDLYFIAYALLVFFPGNPEIYYGDEIFEVGKNDPYCRKGMKWNSKEFNSENNKKFVEILKLKSLNPIKNGEYDITYQDDFTQIRRYNEGESICLVAYKGNQEKAFKLNNATILLSHNFEKGCFKKQGFLVYKII